METQQIKNIIEGALLAAGRPLKLEDMEGLFKEEERPDRGVLREALKTLEADYQERAIDLRQVASGYRIEVRQEVAPWVSRLWEERPSRYSRALLETLALIAYRQPITRGEIEEVRGVSVSSSIIRTLQERGWIKVVGHRDVPGRPAMFGTTREFLDYFGLKSMDELPTLAEIRDIDSINVELELDPDNQYAAQGGDKGQSQAEDEDQGQRHEQDQDQDEYGDGDGDGRAASDEHPEQADSEEAETVVDDPEMGDSVDERNLGDTAGDSPFEESPFANEDDGDDLDFGDSDGEEEQGQQRQADDEQTETPGEAQGTGPEVSESGEEDQSDPERGEDSSR